MAGAKRLKHVFFDWNRRGERLLSLTVLIAFVKVIGRLLSWTPEVLLRGFSRVFGTLIYWLGGKRRRVALGNLYHAYPERTEQWRGRVLRESCCQLVEVVLLVLTSPYMSERRLRKSFVLGDDMRRNWETEAHARDGQPAAVVALVTHASLFEALALLPMLNDSPMPVGTVYRPLNQPAVENWVLSTRQRFGMRMISRKNGLTATNRFLAEGGVVAVLFDQNAGQAGVLTFFYNRVCSNTELPGILAVKHGANVYAVWTERTGFWRGTIRCHPLGRAPQEPAELCFRANQWLENAMRESDGLCSQWLWLHDRWRTQDDPRRRFQLSQRRDALDAHRQWLGLDEMPRGTHFWVRLPNWLGDVVMALPLLRAMRRGRPDGCFTVLCAAHFIPLLEALGVADRYLPLPKKGSPGYWKTFRNWSRLYPHTQVLFTNSARGDIEARLIGAQQRFGIVRKGKPRPLLTRSWKLPVDLDEAAVHQTHLWQRFLGHFGLEQEPDFTPLSFAAAVSQEPVSWQADAPAAASAAAAAADSASGFAGRTIGLICGTENNPEKRWPVERWRELLGSLTASGARCVLFGTAKDAAITAQVADGFDPAAVIDRAGKTDLLHYARELTACDLLITNDTGGMHLANALGLPVLVIFGPTNPVRTGPIFDAPKRCLQPVGCPPQGGASIAGVGVDAVTAAARELLGG